MRHLLILLTLLCILPAMADKIRTGRGRLQSDAQRLGTTVQADTLRAPDTDSILIAGYDKPLRSRFETFFITNHTPSRISSVIVSISYFDSSRRLLHKSTRTISLEIPSGETRQAKIRSWDYQNAFYYHLSPKPLRTAQATPYSVRIDVLGAVIKPVRNGKK